MKTVTINVEGISQGQWSTFLLELNLMKKAWKPYGVVVNLKANRLKSIIENNTIPKISKSKDYVLDLYKYIIFQQISTKAGNSIYNRFLDYYNANKNNTSKYVTEIEDKNNQSTVEGPSKPNRKRTMMFDRPIVKQDD